MDRKQLNNKLRKITDKNLFIQIYQILKTDASFKPSYNSNGIYFDLVLIDESTVNLINGLIEDKPINNQKLEYNSYYIETYSDKLQKEFYKLKH